MKIALSSICISVLLIVSGCQESSSQKNVPSKQSLDWAKGAVWYQIFPERFCNGDWTNDPTVAEVPEARKNIGWQIHPWSSDWYELLPWEQKTGKPFYDGSVVFARRYGGDLIGVIQKLDYLQELGIDAIYFNPVFEAPSLHKYDGSTYHHIDDNFGPDPAGDKRRLANAQETENPATWIWTAADSTFLKLVQLAHQRGIKIVIDGVFNHTGDSFFAFQDILHHGKASRYAHWYNITSWDDPATPQNEFDYKGWWGVKTLPELAEDENGIVAGPREYIFNATKRWLDPNGDGNPEDGIDGWRLDVATDVAPPFWREWYALVKSINPAAITVAEIWDDASEWIQDRRMDNTMNYLFARAVVDFFIDQKTAITGKEFIERLQKILNLYGAETTPILWNLIDSHDTDRLPSMIINPDRNYDHDNGLRNNPNFDIRKPSEQERTVQKLIVAFQMTFIGAPVVYYGDEAGMWGADDPDDRKPMVWPELEYASEKSHPLPGKSRPANANYFDQELHDFYKKLIQLHQKNPALKSGDCQFLAVGEKPDVLAFLRSTEKQQAIALFNRAQTPQSVSLSTELLHFSQFKDGLDGTAYPIQTNKLEIQIPGRSYIILLSE